MYKSLREMKPGQKFVVKNKVDFDVRKADWIPHMDKYLGETIEIYKVFDKDTIATEGIRYFFNNEVVDWAATNALYAQDTYTAEIHALLEAQKNKGVRTYGTTLENGTVGAIEVIDHAMAEAADLLYYLTHLKAKLREKFDV